MKKIFFVLWLLLLVFGLMQFFQISKTNPPFDLEEDFLQLTQAPPHIATVLKNACYDCHAHTTIYPWYAYINPVGWWIGHHIEEGREELNFSKWGQLSGKKQEKMLQECIKEIQRNKMPLKSYTFTHSAANLSQVEKAQLIDWFKTLID